MLNLQELQRLQKHKFLIIAGASNAFPVTLNFVAHTYSFTFKVALKLICLVFSRHKPFPTTRITIGSNFFAIGRFNFNKHIVYSAAADEGAIYRLSISETWEQQNRKEKAK